MQIIKVSGVVRGLWWPVGYRDLEIYAYHPMCSFILKTVKVYRNSVSSVKHVSHFSLQLSFEIFFSLINCPQVQKHV
jgi:hypothetical protein